MKAEKKEYKEKKPYDLKVVVEPNFGISKAGKPFLSFVAKTTDGLTTKKVLVFNENAEACRQAALAVGQEVYVMASIGKEEETLLASYIKIKKDGGSFTDYENAFYGSAKKRAEAKIQKDELVRKAGLCRVYGARAREGEDFYAVTYRKKKDCVFHKGKWKRKIDYVLEVLPPAEVMKELKACNDLYKGDDLNSIVSSIKPDIYKQWLDSMVSIAKQSDGTKEKSRWWDL